VGQRPGVPGLCGEGGEACGVGQNVANRIDDIQFRNADAAGLWVGQGGAAQLTPFDQKGAARVQHGQVVGLRGVHTGTVQYSTVQYSTVQYSTGQYGPVRYSTVEHSTAQHSTVM